jgi:hypothetical protein
MIVQVHCVSARSVRWAAGIGPAVAVGPPVIGLKRCLLGWVAFTLCSLLGLYLLLQRTINTMYT